MPNVSRYVDTDADSGGNGTTSNLSSGDGTHAYDSIANLLTGEGGVGNNVIMYVYCNRGTTTTADTTAVDFTGFTFGNSISFIYILPNDTDYDIYSGADNTSYHYGVYDAGYVVYTTSNNTNTFKMNTDQGSVRGIESRNEPVNASGGTCFMLGASGTQRTHRDLIGRSTGATYGVTIFSCYTVQLENCISDQYGGPAIYSGFRSNDYTDNNFINCLAANGGRGFTAQATGGVDPTCINCVAYNCTTDYVDLGGGWDTTNSTNCATTDASAAESWVTQTSVSTSANGDFIDPSNKDWRVYSGSTKIKDQGNSGGTAVDIALNARS